MDQEGIDSVYGLSKTFFVHGGAARTVDVKGDKMVSGGIDKKVVYFERGENGIFEKKSEYRFFPDYVYQVKIMEDEDQFMVACKDGKIYICMFADTEAPMLLLEGKNSKILLLFFPLEFSLIFFPFILFPLKNLLTKIGHTGPVNSLHQKGMKLVSGSWDATAKIWDLESGEASATMGGHSYAVTVCILENGLIITGSQDGALRLWSGDGTLVKTKHAAHGDIIREIIEVPNIGILTCANDASIKLWGAMNLEQFGEYQHHESYVFALESLGGSNFVSGGEDKRLKVCVDQKIVDDILHPNTIWSIVLDTKNDNDLITTCGDG
jgi:WD40 repeat protein